MTEAEWLACAHPEAILHFLRGGDKNTERKARLFGVVCCRRIWHLLGSEPERRAVEVAEQFADGRVDEAERRAALRTLLMTFGSHPDEKQSGSTPGFHSSDFTVILGPAPLAAALVVKTDTESLICGFTGRCLDGGGRGGDPSYWASGISLFAARAAAWAAGLHRENEHRLWYAVTRPIRRFIHGFDPRFCVRTLRSEEQQQTAVLRDLFGPLPFREVHVHPGWLLWSGCTVRKLAEGIYEDRSFGRLPILADALEDAGCADESILTHLRSPGPHYRGCWPVDLLLEKS